MVCTARRCSLLAFALSFCLLPVGVSGKGCFVPSTPVTMADGSWRMIKDIRVGEQVRSWDAAQRRVAPARVQKILEVYRDEKDLVSISTQGSTIWATVDHPFWSLGRGALVSMDPETTQKNYGLAALRMQLGELLEDETQMPVNVTSIGRSGTGVCEADEDRRIRVAGQAKVMTLKLEQHHWFYVHGVRVHNKGGGGCFAPWTRIRMGTDSLEVEKAIQDIRVKDTVLSWDESAHRFVDATVLGIDIVRAPSSLLEISYDSAQVCETFKGGPQICLSKAMPTNTSLVLTRDHPVFSVRGGGLVSMDPKMTARRYGLEVGHIACEEKLHHYLDHAVQARVEPWDGRQKVTKVMTLRLDQHHWFFAQGVRVHNKGGGGSRGGDAGGGGAGGSRTVTRSTYGSTRAYVVVAVWGFGGTRRRYGTYNQEGACNLTTNVEQQCTSLIAPYSSDFHNQTQVAITGSNCAYTAHCCHACMACSAESCMDNIAGCEAFLDAIHSECTETSEGPDVIVVILIIVGVLVGVGCCIFFCLFGRGRQDSQAVYDAFNAHMNMDGDCGQLPPSINLQGSYFEEGESHQCSYSLALAPDGSFSGTGMDNDGGSTVQGKLNVSLGRIFWKEEQTSGSAVSLMSGSIFITGNQITASIEYQSSWSGIQGTMSLSGFLPGPFVQESPAVVIGAVVSNPGAPVGLTNHAGSGSQPVYIEATPLKSMADK